MENQVKRLLSESSSGQSDFFVLNDEQVNFVAYIASTKFHDAGLEVYGAHFTPQDAMYEVKGASHKTYTTCAGDPEQEGQIAQTGKAKAKRVGKLAVRVVEGIFSLGATEAVTAAVKKLGKVEAGRAAARAARHADDTVIDTLKAPPKGWVAPTRPYVKFSNVSQEQWPVYAPLPWPTLLPLALSTPSLRLRPCLDERGWAWSTVGVTLSTTEYH